MARIFMSVLGTSCYVEAQYKLEEDVSAPTPFVQEAYLTLTKDSWSKEDRLIFFLTDKARKKSWEDGGNFEEGLYSRLKKLSLAAKVVALPFKEGYTEEDIMQNFLTIVEQLYEGDEVIFDITHSFRSLPMLNLVALNYARVLRGARIERIHYGAFEVLGEPREVKENIPVEQRIAPIFDLTPYVTLMDWAFAVDDFVRYGMAERLAEMVRAKAIPVLRETRGEDERAKAFRKFIDSLHGLAMSIYTCRCRELMERDWKSLDLEKLSQSYTFLPPFVPLLEKLEQKVKGFVDGDSWSKAEAAVKWCLEHGMIQQGYTILQEAIITETARIMGVDDVYDKDQRKFVSSLLSVKVQKKPLEEWKGVLGDRREEAIEWCEKGGEHLDRLAVAFDRLSKLRNDINHCGCRKDPRKPKDLVEKLEKCFSEAREGLRGLR